jgi:hypothetical protein
MYRIPWGPPVFIHVSMLRAASDKKGPEGEDEAGDREHVQHEEHQVVACKKKRFRSDVNRGVR